MLVKPNLKDEEIIACSMLEFNLLSEVERNAAIN
jgi:hypothetical protein